MSVARGRQRIERNKRLPHPVITVGGTSEAGAWYGEAIVALTFNQTIAGTDRGVIATAYTATIGPIPSLHTGIGVITLTETVSTVVASQTFGAIAFPLALATDVIGTHEKTPWPLVNIPSGFVRFAG